MLTLNEKTTTKTHKATARGLNDYKDMQNYNLMQNENKDTPNNQEVTCDY